MGLMIGTVVAFTVTAQRSLFTQLPLPFVFPWLVPRPPPLVPRPPPPGRIFRPIFGLCMLIFPLPPVRSWPPCLVTCASPNVHFSHAATRTSVLMRGTTPSTTPPVHTPSNAHPPTRTHPPAPPRARTRTQTHAPPRTDGRRGVMAWLLPTALASALVAALLPAAALLRRRIAALLRALA